MAGHRVVTCFLTRGSKILVLRRSDKVGTYPGLWAGVSGFVEGEEDPGDRAWLEIQEETGIEAERLELLKRGEALSVQDPGLARQWIVHPFLFRIAEGVRVRLDWEHEAFQWIDPGDLGSLDTVPDLVEAYNRVGDALP